MPVSQPHNLRGSDSSETNENQTRRFPNLLVSLAWGESGDKRHKGFLRVLRVLPYLDTRP